VGKKLAECLDILSRRFGIRIVLERLDHRHQVGQGLVHQAGEHEAGAAHHNDVGAAVRQLLVHPHLGHAADRPRSRRLRRLGRGGDSEPPVSRQAVGQHPPVTRLEDMQRQRIPGEEHDREGKNRKPEGHGSNVRRNEGTRERGNREGGRGRRRRERERRPVVASPLTAVSSFPRSHVPSFDYAAPQNPRNALTSAESRSFSKARSRIWRMRSRVTPRSAPIFSRVRASEPSSRP
jgi:hypothetical protein